MGSLITTLTRILPLIIGTMGAVESMFKALKGKSVEKSEAFIAGIMSALGVTEATLGKDIVNDERFKTLLKKIADAIIELNNFIRDYKSPNDGSNNSTT